MYTLRKAIAPKNHAVNHIHILALSLILGDIFIFESVDSVKSEKQADPFAVDISTASLLLDSHHTDSLKRRFPSHSVSQQPVLHMARFTLL